MHNGSNIDQILNVKISESPVDACALVCIQLNQSVHTEFLL